jgi:predicted nucleic acid-binding protein
VSPASAAELIRATVVPRVHTIDLGAEDLTGAIGRADRVGVRGGAIFDYLHLVAARRASSSALYTLDARHFAVLARNEGPEIRVPE